MIGETRPVRCRADAPVCPAVYSDVILTVGVDEAVRAPNTELSRSLRIQI